MDTIQVRGYINHEGKLEVEIPAGLPEGEVKVQIELTQANTDELPWELRPWTKEELDELLQPRPAKTGAEIAERVQKTSGWWEQQGITDPVAWLEELRQREQENRNS
ncbi:MAG: hypothetical protein H7X77_07215 [Anaerolineae bacterium]|nr:hypothetical protein [Anaerolineae bacterium]